MIRIMRTYTPRTDSMSTHFFFLFSFIILSLFLNFTSAQFYVCNVTSPCVNGACCSVNSGETSGLCGYDPDNSCGSTCVSNCNATAECGKWAATAGTKCPLNVCCCLNTGGTVTNSKRDTQQCYLPPALFYNCDWFQSAIVNNLNSDTYEDTPFVTIPGICDNIKKYLDRNSGKPNVWPNSMLLTYKKGGGGNRGKACKTKGPECSRLKQSLWPKNGAQPRAQTMSCDEFPFNASGEGGTNAEAACVPEAQQKYQGPINSIVSRITETQSGRAWKDISGGTKYYTMNLYSYWSDKNDVGTLGGTFDTSAANNPTINSGTGLMYVLGGVNLQGNPQYTVVSNGVCLQLPLESEFKKGIKISMYKYEACDIEFETPDTLVSRGLDPRNPDNWVIKNVTLSDKPLEEDSPLKDMVDYLNNFDLDDKSLTWMIKVM